MPAAIAGKLTLPAMKATMARLATIALSNFMARMNGMLAIFHGGRLQRNWRIEKLTALLRHSTAKRQRTCPGRKGHGNPPLGPADQGTGRWRRQHPGQTALSAGAPAKPTPAFEPASPAPTITSF